MDFETYKQEILKPKAKHPKYDKAQDEYIINAFKDVLIEKDVDRLTAAYNKHFNLSRNARAISRRYGKLCAQRQLIPKVLILDVRRGFKEGSRL